MPVAKEDLTSTNLCHLIGYFVSGFQSFDKSTGSNQGSLDRGSKLPWHITKGPDSVHIVRNTAHVNSGETILPIQDL